MTIRSRHLYRLTQDVSNKIMFIINEIYSLASLNDVNDIIILLKAVFSDRITKKLSTKIKNRTRLLKSTTT